MRDLYKLIAKIKKYLKRFRRPTVQSYPRRRIKHVQKKNPSRQKCRSREKKKTKSKLISKKYNYLTYFSDGQ